MNIHLFAKRTAYTALMMLPVFLSGCVTQNYENEDKPVVQNQANRDDMAATRVSLGLGYLKMGNMPQAKQNLEKAKNFAPEMVQVYTAFAHYYETVGEPELTVESYEKALSLKSDDADTLNNYGVYLCRQGEIEAAEKQFLKAIAVPTYILVAKSYENLSSCFLQKDNFNKAEQYLNKAISHSPSSSSTLFQMIQLQYAKGNYKLAKSFQQRFEKVSRRFSPQSIALAYKVHYKLRQRGIAKNYGAMLVKMYPQSWEAQQYLLNELELIEADNLAKRYQMSQEDSESIKPKKRVVKLSPKNIKPLKNDATINDHKKNETIDGATKSKNAVKLKPTNESMVRVKNEQSKIPLPTAGEKNSKEKHSLVVTQEKVRETEVGKVTENIKKTAKESTKVVKKERNQKFPDFHIVEAGDTLYSLSVKYNIKIKALRKWNKIYKNKKLHIKDIIFLENPKLVNQ